MATDQNDEIVLLKQQLVEKDHTLSRLKEEKDLLEENLDEQEENIKDIRNSFQKRIEELTNDIDEKDEQIDSMSEEISSLKNNNQVDELDGSSSPDVVNSLKEQIRIKDETVTDMREKLNKGGMTINNLHMEIRELKESLSENKDIISDKTAKIKDMREDNGKMKSTIYELQQRLESAQENVESTQQSSDDTGGKVQLEVLKKEIERKKEELMSTRIALEKCQKELSDLKSLKPSEAKRTHSEDENDKMAKMLEEYKQEKSRYSDIQLKLDKSQSDLKKVVAFFTCMVLAFIVGKVFY